MGIWWCPGCRADAPADNGLVAGLLREGRVSANGLRFAYLEGGSGPLVVLLHGWPDTPHTWDHQLAALAGAGFRVAAPWLRGYPPTEIPRSGYFDIGTLAVDVRELIRVLGGGDPCLLVGQDWGASIGYQVLAAFPEVVRSAVVMAVPHPAATRESLAARRACPPVLPRSIFRKRYTEMITRVSLDLAYGATVLSSRTVVSLCTG